MDDLTSAIHKLVRYAYARDREIEREPRVIELTDDEAIALLARLDEGRPDG